MRKKRTEPGVASASRHERRSSHGIAGGRMGDGNSRATASDFKAVERAGEQSGRNGGLDEAAGATRDRFLAGVSHELRTPLTPALFAASLLCAWQDLPEEARKLAFTIKRNLEFEARLIDALLDLVRVTQNVVPLAVENLDLHDVVREAIDACRAPASAKQVRLAVRLVAGRHHIVGDPNRLRQVFWHLVTNAINFTSAGGTVVVASANPAGSLVRLSVRDTGEGMDRSTLEHLFTPFDRHPDPSSSRSGLGLGLAIAERIVTAHAGRIRASSDGHGRGSTFSVELGTVAPETQPSHDRHVGDMGAPPDPVHGVRVLIVEDDADSRAMVAQSLVARGYHVETASSVRSAIERLSEHWDIVLSDIGLPDGTGLEVARHARQLKDAPRKMIAFSGLGSSDDIRASREAGFDIHLVKPIDVDTLLALFQLSEPPRRSDTAPRRRRRSTGRIAPGHPPDDRKSPAHPGDPDRTSSLRT